MDTVGATSGWAAQYLLRAWAITVYLGLIVLIFAVFQMWQNPEQRVVDIEALLPGFYMHTSNLLLSCVLVLLYGVLRLVYGAPLREMVAFGAVVVAANWVYEVLLTLWNARDVVDPVYGTVEAVLALGFLALARAKGPQGREER